MKLIQLFICSVFIFPLGMSAQTKASITIENHSELERKDAVIAVKWETVIARYPQIDTANFVVIDPLTKKQLPFQLEHRGLSSIQNLLVQVTVKAKSSLNLFIQKGKPQTFTTKTYGRYVPERKDDFAWENDKIAFRAYGKAIENSKEDAYGFDVWVKRSPKMVLNDRYKRADYHIDHGDGMDYYHVGFSLGAGNMAPYIKDTIRYSANYHQWKVLDNGPLRTTFQLIYDTWNAGGVKVKAVKTISLDAGSQLNRVENIYTFDDNKPMPVVVGIIRRPQTGVISLNEQQGVMGYWEPTSTEYGTTGVGSILTTAVSTMWINKEQILAQTNVTNNQPIVYYTGAAWDRAGTITSAKQWFDYLDRFYKETQSPLQINVK